MEDLTGEDDGLDIDGSKVDKKDGEEEESGLKPVEGEPEFIYIDFRRDRSCKNKLARMMYVLLRMFFASIWFYFIPFVSIYLSYSIPYRFINDGDDSTAVDDPVQIIVPV